MSRSVPVYQRAEVYHRTRLYQLYQLGSPLHFRGVAVKVNEDMKAGINAVFDQGVELVGAFHLGELLHNKVLLFGGHVFAGEVKGAAGRVRRQTALATDLERVRVAGI